MASCHTHATLCQSSHRIHRIHRSFLRRIFSHGFHRSTQKLVPLRGCTCLKCTSRARSAPTEQTCHLFCLCSRDSCTPWLAAWVWQGCHTLLICAHLCLSVGGTSLPECSVCSAYSVGHSLCLLCWCCRGSCTSVVVFSPRNSRNSRNVRLRYWRRGYGRDAIPS